MNHAMGHASATAEAKNITLSVNAPANLPALLGDEKRVLQIFTHILDNAVKFTPDDGTVTFSAAMAQDHSFVFEIKDNGIGIDSTDIQRTFEPFEQLDNTSTRAQEGAGLGLSICKLLMQLHQGSIAIESQVNRSTCVTLRFPPSRTFMQITSAA